MTSAQPLATTDAVTALIAAGDVADVLTYTVSRADTGRRVVWTGGRRNGVAIPSGDLTFSASDLATYDRLVVALRDGGFVLYR